MWVFYHYCATGYKVPAVYLLFIHDRTTGPQQTNKWNDHQGEIIQTIMATRKIIQEQAKNVVLNLVLFIFMWPGLAWTRPMLVTLIIEY